MPRPLVLLFVASLLSLLSGCDASGQVHWFPGASHPPAAAAAADPGALGTATDYVSMSTRLAPSAPGRGILYTDSQTGKVRMIDAAGYSVEMGTADRAQTFSSAPGTPSEGSIYGNTTAHTLNYYDGSSFKTLATTAGTVPTTRQIICGNGLAGCGDFSADRTMSVSLAATPGLQFSGGGVAVLPKPGGGLAVDSGGVYQSASGVSAASYPTSGQIPTFTVNASGHLTAAGSSTDGSGLASLNASSLTSGTVPTARLSAIPNASLANSSVSLTAGTGLTGGGSCSLGASCPAMSIDSTVVTRTGTQTLTNKTIDGASNTLSNIPLGSGVTGVLGVANGGTGQSTLTSYAVLVGAGSSISLVGPGNGGQVLTGQGMFASPTFANPVTATYGTATLGSTYTIPTDNGSYASTGLTIPLPSDGTYAVFYEVRSNIQASTTAGAYILTELYNVTDASVVTDSEKIGAYGSTINVAYYGSATAIMIVTVNGSKTMAVYAKCVAPSSTATRTINSDANGRSRIGYVKLSN